MHRYSLVMPFLAVAAAIGLWRVGNLRAERGGYHDPQYSNTPRAAAPFKDLRKPHARFFMEDTPFLGPGREKQEPKDIDTVRIGFLGPVEDSPDEELGRDMLRGARLAVEQANEAGGYRGELPFELMVHNDRAVWGASSNEVVAMAYDENVWGLIGSLDGANTHIALRVVLKVELPMVCTGSTDPTITETRIPWLVRCTADDRQNGYALARYAFNKQGYKRPAGLRANGRYGRMGIREFRDTARRMGFPLVAEVRYPPEETDFRDELALIRRAEPDCLVVWGEARELGHAVKQLRAAGMDLPVLGPDRILCDEFLELTGEAAEGVVATYPYDPRRSDPVLEQFQRSFRAKFDLEPTHFAAHCFDGTNMLIESIRKAGLNRVRIRDVLLAMDGYHGVTGDLPLDASWNDVGPVWLAEVRDGEFRFLGTADEVMHDSAS